MRVLLTNDDGIEAAGLQALRRALLAIDGDRAGGDRPRRQPLGDGALDHHPPAAVGPGGRLRRRHGRLRHRRHAGGLRAAGQPRAGRGVRGRAGRLGDQPRLQPRRRHHLLGHGGGGARGDRARPARDRGLAAVERAGARLPLGRRRSTSRSRRRSRRAWWPSSRTSPLPDGHAAEHQRARRRTRRASRSRGWASASTATSCRSSTRTPAAGGCTGSTATRATSATRPAPTWPRSRRARSRSRRSTST